MDFEGWARRVATRLGAELNYRAGDEYEDEEPEALLQLQLEGHRSQELSVSPTAQGEQSFLRLTTRVGPADGLTPERMRQVLGLNAGLVYGAFALSEGSLVLTATLEADPAEAAAGRLRPADLELAPRVMTHLATSADQMERALFGTDRS